MPDTEKDQQLKLVELVREAVRQDEELRQKHQVGDKFRFIRDRLAALLERLEKSLTQLQVEEEKAKSPKLANESTVFVYLYNAHGVTVRSWNNLLLPKVFYEYSVNRPIYTDKNYVEALIRSKKNKLQHGYLTVAIKPEDIIQPSGASAKDIIGNPVIKVREGSLKFEKLIAFTHNELDYVVNEEGELIKKEEE